MLKLVNYFPHAFRRLNLAHKTLSNSQSQAMQ